MKARGGGATNNISSVSNKTPHLIGWAYLMRFLGISVEWSGGGYVYLSRYVR